MNIKNLTRQEKERLYIKKMTKLQLKWKNPVDSDWDFGKWTDEELDSGLKDVIGQLRFERGYSVFALVVAVIGGLIVAMLYKAYF